MSDESILAEVYGITFTERELVLLTTSKGLLDPYSKQQAYLLKMALRFENCPACSYILCPRSAWTGKKTGKPSPSWPGAPESIDLSWAGDGDEGDLFACPACKARLVHRTGLVMDDHWFTLASGQVVKEEA